jgi:beta-galactosidase
MPTSKVAIIRDFKNDWAFEDGRFCFDFRYMREVFKYYRSLRNASITTDVISSADSFDKYSLIVVPSMVLTNVNVSQRLKIAAQNGATIVITCMTGLRNDNMASFGRILDASIEELAGITMEEQHALIGVEQTQLKLINDTATYKCGLWHDVFSLKTAMPIGFYDSRFFKGKPVITKNSFGKGTVYYVGSVVDEVVVESIIKQSLKTASIIPLAVSKNELVELTEVAGEKGRFLFAINYSTQDEKIELNTKFTDVIKHEVISHEVVIKARDFRVFQLSN